MRTEEARRRLEQIEKRHARRRRNPTPDQVIECMEDCDTLLYLLEKALKLREGS